MATQTKVGYTTMIRDPPRGERPRERIREHGAGYLSNAELIAILLRTGIEGENVVNLAAFELGRRLVSLHREDRAVIQCPDDVANLLGAEMGLLDQEHLRAVHLDTKNRVTGVSEIYIGNVNSAVVRPAEVFRPAIRDKSVAIIVVHNHPSGDPTPSPEDIAITGQLRESGELLGIELLDHVILGAQRQVSLKEKGLGFK